MNLQGRLTTIAVFVLITMAIVLFFGSVALKKMERITVAVERIEAQVTRVAEAAGDKAIQVIGEMDAPALAEGATEGVKEVGRAVKTKAIDLLRKRVPGTEFVQ